MRSILCGIVDGGKFRLASIHNSSLRQVASKCSGSISLQGRFDHHINASRRQFSVKELPWCSSSDSPNHRRHAATTSARTNGPKAKEEHHHTTNENKTIFQPIEKFGIVAAMAAHNRVIGLHGALPWKSPTDRNLFKTLTKDRILIVGRKTLQEEQQQSLGHVRHTKYCIVVSTTTSNLDELLKGPASERDQDWHKLKLAGSLDEALDMARRLEKYVDCANDEGYDSPRSDLKCWVAGGERLFDEALKHSSVSEIHLSTVHVDVDITNVPLDHVARFPAKYRWDHNYQELFSKLFDESSIQSSEPTFTYQVYKRIQRSLPGR
jgi:dihydrofolate reductase